MGRGGEGERESPPPQEYAMSRLLSNIAQKYFNTALLNALISWSSEKEQCSYDFSVRFHCSGRFACNLCCHWHLHMEKTTNKTSWFVLDNSLKRMLRTLNFQDT